jgi:carboxymethylenebutenolidase
MRIRIVGIAVAVFALTALHALRAAKPSASSPVGAPAAMHSALPSVKTAKMVLSTTPRHREWINVQEGSATIWAFLVYPQRADNASVVVVTAKNQGASDWARAVSDQVAAEGFIAVVPDVLSGLGPNAGGTESFASNDDVVIALNRLGHDEAARRIEAVREYAVSLPAANGKSASFEFSPGAGDDAWRNAIAVLTKETGNKPVWGIDTLAMTGTMSAEDHSAHMMMAMAQPSAAAPPPAQGGPVGYPLGKLPNLPAGIFNAKSTLLHSTLRKEFVDIPAGNVKLHVWIEYPPGNDKAPVILVMQHGPGLDEWQRSLADQVALEGFIAIAPDLYSGLGPNGGNFDSFEGSDDAMRSSAKLSQDEGIRRYKAAYDYAMKLPRANGKSATVGFCAGGSYSFRFAGEVPTINGAVVFYGTQPSEEIMAKIKAPVLGFYGDDDARVTSTVAPTIAAMEKLGKSYEPHIYAHGTHGFLEYQDLGGNPAAVTDSWQRTIAFLKQQMK